MEKTFSQRRLEIVEQRPMVGDFKSRWPALFQQSECENGKLDKRFDWNLAETLLAECVSVGGPLPQEPVIGMGPAECQIDQVLAGLSAAECLHLCIPPSVEIP
ncbi:hypothetical protein NQZ68_019168 [Dissostichus eleginoides]|nr:hypothetical protein NQZ68_019168 [Dissostichus eleginoides]